MLYRVSDLIARAKAFVDDENTSVQSWITDSTWTAWINVEYQQLYRKLLTSGLVGPLYTDLALTIDSAGSASITIDDSVMAVESVVENFSDGGVRYLSPAQPGQGRMTTEGTPKGTPIWWSVQGIGSQLNLELRPVPTSGSYTIRYVAEPLKLVPTVVDADTEIDQINLPAGTEDRLVLGMANRALVKEGSASPALYGMVKNADEEIALQAAGRIMSNAPMVRRNHYWTSQHRYGLGPVTSGGPSNWWWV